MVKVKKKIKKGLSMKKTAIVIGGTGLIGSNLIHKLEKADHIEKIISITRSRVKYESEKIQNKVINFEKMGEFKDYFSGDILFSCLGTTLKKAGSIKAQRKIDLDYQFQAAKLASENGVKNYVLVSSSGANPQSKNNYLKMKGELEKKVDSLGFHSITLFRPSLLVGKRNEFRLGEKIGSYLMPFLCILPGLKKYRPIKGEIVAEKMTEISSNELSGKIIFELDEIFQIKN